MLIIRPTFMLLKRAAPVATVMPSVSTAVCISTALRNSSDRKRSEDDPLLLTAATPVHTLCAHPLSRVSRTRHVANQPTAAAEAPGMEVLRKAQRSQQRRWTPNSQPPAWMISL